MMYNFKIKTMKSLKKIKKGYYYDKESGNCIVKQNGKWNVWQECTGELFYSAKTLKECKRFQVIENEIRSWND